MMPYLWSYIQVVHRETGPSEAANADSDGDTSDSANGCHHVGGDDEEHHLEHEGCKTGEICLNDTVNCAFEIDFKKSGQSVNFLLAR